MAPLGPFGAAPRLVAGVSGGPHSLALALLAHGWARAQGGRLVAVVADHGLRSDSAAEAEAVRACLHVRGIESRVVRLAVPQGPALQRRARDARLGALLDACAALGAPWLLLGHHRGDQAETVLLRALAGSADAGLAAMAPVRAAAEALILRPLLDVPPARLEATLRALAVTPFRDPSNRDPRFTRVRLRAALGDPDGKGAAVAGLASAAGRFAARRDRAEAGVAARLSSAASIYPEGFARLDPVALGHDGVAVAALAALLRLVAGARYAPPREGVAALLARGKGTLGGARLLRAGQLLLAIREATAMAPPVPARAGAVWDGRFRLEGPGAAGYEIGALGPGSAPGARPARPSWLPSAAWQALPAVRRDGMLVAVPGVVYREDWMSTAFRITFAPEGGPLP